MKFFLGFVTGIIVTIITLYIFYRSSSNEEELQGLTLFKKSGECITKRKLKVFQTVRENAALAEFGTYPNEMTVLLINYDGVSYYDDQSIVVPKNKCARRIGTYSYSTRVGFQKTVPVVEIQ
ncbi:hypothetical protein ACQKCH_15505 [Nubsella zeaxanthinifaciens]|uniref:hypothetical protein n=1 Tax=Nubsella zeaxanthinifaciens TaxID=392412 RepID=UPI003D05E848